MKNVAIVPELAKNMNLITTIGVKLGTPHGKKLLRKGNPFACAFEKALKNRSA
jgi:hypothetical protein